MDCNIITIKTPDLEKTYTNTSTDKPAAMQATVYDLVLQRVRLRAKRRVEWLRKVWGQFRDENGECSGKLEIDGNLVHADDPITEKHWIENEPSINDLNKSIKDTEQQLTRDTGSRLARMIDVFGLNTLEADIIQTCLAQYIDPNLSRVFSYLQDHAGKDYVSVQLVCRLFGHGLFVAIGPSSPLVAWSITTEKQTAKTESIRLELTPFIRNWLLGINDIDDTLIGLSHMQEPGLSFTSWNIPRTAEKIAGLLKRGPGQPLRIIIHGNKGAGRTMFAAALCKELGLPLLTILDTPLDTHEWTVLYRNAQRQAWLANCALLWQGDTIAERIWPQYVSSFLIQFVLSETDEDIRPAAGFTDHRLDLPAMPFEETLFLLQQWIPASRKWPQDQLKEFINSRHITIGQLADVSVKNVSSLSEAIQELRYASRKSFDGLAQPVHSSFTWNDIVVAPSVNQHLEDFYFEASERQQLWEMKSVQRLFPQGRGLLALFTGAPGTGKTMAAQVIANTLCMDLVRVDLSAIVSKYIGDTSKHIQRILSRASSMDIILLFDEADALFGKRTAETKDAHDRLLNTDTNYLLQAIENYPGIAILASNRKSNIDNAFLRRIRHVIEFPRPDEGERLQLWQQLVKAMTDEKTAADLDGALTSLSKLLELTGAQIKLAVLSAVYMARKDKKTLGIQHLVRGAEREMAKEGKGTGKQVQDLINKTTQ